MKSVLIADDEADLREILEMNISLDFDNPIILVKNGKEAIAELEKKEDEIGLIICDYSMPLANGAKVFDYNKINKNIPFILLTGNVLEECKDIHNFYETNPKNLVVGKPWDEDSLISAIKGILG